MASAGRMPPKPNTLSAGRLITPITSPDSTMTLSRTLVNKPKYAFRSPGVHSLGAGDPPRSVFADVLTDIPPWFHGVQTLRDVQGLLSYQLAMHNSLIFP